MTREISSVDVAGYAFEQHVGGIAEHSNDADDDDAGDEEREQGIDPRGPRHRNRDAAKDDRRAAKRIAEDVKEHRPYVEIALAVGTQQERHAPVDRKPDGGDEDHQARSGLYRQREASHGLIDDRDRCDE